MGVDCCNHSTQLTRSQSTHRLHWVMIITGLFMLVEFFGGMWTNSLALITDAGHMLSDTASLWIALVAARLTERPPSRFKTYGYQRAEVLAAFVNALILLALAVLIVREGLQRIHQPEKILSTEMIVIAVGGLIVNLIGIRLLHHVKHETLNTRGAYLHIVGDLIGSIAAIMSGIIIHVTDWVLADVIVSFILAALIVVGAFRLFWDTTHILMQGTPADCDLPGIEKDLLKLPGIKRISHLHVWCLGSQTRVATIHVLVSQDADPFGVQEATHRYLVTERGIQHPTVQVERE